MPCGPKHTGQLPFLKSFQLSPISSLAQEQLIHPTVSTLLSQYHPITQAPKETFAHQWGQPEKKKRNKLSGNMSNSQVPTGLKDSQADPIVP